MYKSHNGHLDVPQRDVNNKALGAFVSNIRGEYRKYKRGQKSCLNEKRIRLLEGMGFRWQVSRGKKDRDLESMVSWETRVGQLRDYKERFGDCNVPLGWGKVSGLGDWCELQRKVRLLRFIVLYCVKYMLTRSILYAQLQKFNNGSLSSEQIHTLDELGFNWTIQDMMTELKAYKEQFGHCNVPLDYAACPNLGVWVESQRRVSFLFLV